MERMINKKISESVRNQNQCNSNEDEHAFEESHLGKSCEEVVIDVSSPSLERIDLVTHTPLKSLLTYLVHHPPFPLSTPW